MFTKVCPIDGKLTRRSEKLPYAFDSEAWKVCDVKHCRMTGLTGYHKCTSADSSETDVGARYQEMKYEDEGGSRGACTVPWRMRQCCTEGRHARRRPWICQTISQMAPLGIVKGLTENMYHQDKLLNQSERGWDQIQVEELWRNLHPGNSWPRVQFKDKHGNRVHLVVRPVWNERACWGRHVLQAAAASHAGLCLHSAQCPGNYHRDSHLQLSVSSGIGAGPKEC